MSPKRREQVTGLHPGPYTVSKITSADVTVSAQGEEGPVVVGRFPCLKQIDAKAQAKAYAAMPEAFALIRQFSEAFPNIEENEHLSGADMITFVTHWMRDADALLTKAGAK
jgi:hypothetical protein